MTQTLSLNAREQHARRLATSVGLRLKKGRPRIANVAPGYMLIDAEINGVVFGSDYDATLDQIEQFLTSKR